LQRWGSEKVLGERVIEREFFGDGGQAALPSWVAWTHESQASRAARDRWSELTVELRRVEGSVSGHGGCDDTILPMLSVGKTQSSRMWVYVGDANHPYNVFDFTLNRGRDGPKYFLKDYEQVLLADAYGGTTAWW